MNSRLGGGYRRRETRLRRFGIRADALNEQEMRYRDYNERQ